MRDTDDWLNTDRPAGGMTIRSRPTPPHRVVDVTDAPDCATLPSAEAPPHTKDGAAHATIPRMIDVTDPPADSERMRLPSTASRGGLLSAGPVALIAKRTLDVVIASTMILLLAPLWLLVAVLVKATSEGPVLFVQERVGRFGKPFPMFKFRSMVTDAEARKADLADLNECTGPVFKISNDPRVTPLGRVIRRTSLDELPQLLNVLRGEMSLVGPRPPLATECAQYTDHQWRRLDVTPGLTCVWQVSGRTHVDFAAWVEMDLRYIQEWSLLLDLKLLMLTVPAVLGRRGAY